MNTRTFRFIWSESSGMYQGEANAYSPEEANGQISDCLGADAAPGVYDVSIVAAEDGTPSSLVVTVPPAAAAAQPGDPA